nr:uncharacterized protein LOC107452830 isoform X2 [Parasteatoda tepidariorum]
MSGNRYDSGLWAPCGYLKKTNPGNELVQNESFKYFPTKNDLLIKFKKSTSSNFSSSTSYEKIEREHLGVSKSLNDITVLRQEINNNFVDALTEPKNNQKGKDTQQSSIILKTVKEDKCNSNPSFSSLPTSSLLNASNTVPFVTTQNGNKMLLVIQENSDLSTETQSPFKVDYSNAQIPSSLPYTAQVNDLSFSRRNGDIENEMQNTAMSGISPSTTSQYGNKNKVDLQHINYRISTSVIENNKTLQMETTSVEGQSFHLPSSIYGTPASTVEKMLTNQETSDKVNKEGKTSFLQEILEQKSVKSKINSSDLNSEIKNVGPDSFAASATTFSNLNLPMSDNERSYPKLKLSIPDALATDDSNSSVFSTESSKSLKFPRITSPQILEQHINKLISNNIAIIDTVDAVWSRRYSKQISTSAAPDGESKKVAQKPEKPNEEKTTSLNFVEGGAKSKLQSALLRGSEEVIANSNKNSLLPKIPLSKDKIPSQINNIPNNAVPVTPYTKVITTVSEEELKGNAIKSLLSLRQGQYIKETNVFDKDAFAQHPQNPEGSIIKDLLLKSKSQEDLRIYNEDNFYETSYQRKILNHRLTTPLFKCSRCNAEFPDKFSYENHCALCSNYIGNNLLALRDHVKDINAQSKSLSLECQSKGKKIVQPENLNTVSIDDDDGPILKKQLLMPLAKSPPIKRRKVSDSVISPSYFSNQNNDLKNFSTKLLNSDLMPYRSRSQSVHLFGGEVQVLDGYRTKKIKIQNLHGAFSTLPTKFTDNSVVKPNFSTDIDNDVSNLSAALVTIAQPVHNSGGTLHLPTRLTTSCLTPTVTAPNAIADVSNYTRLESATASSNVSKTIHIPSNRDTQFPLYNKSVLKQSQTPELFYSSVKGSVLPGPPNDELSTIVKANVSPSNKLFYSPIFSTIDDKFETFTKGKDTESKGSHVVPTVLFTPSSPTFSAADEEVSPANSISEPNKKFLAPTRPTSLPLKKKAVTMVSFGTGTTLISPETPRPKKNCVQLYLNGHAYTYLGLKCSTRSTYCCIYRPQPMFVLQDTNPKLSMYSNWQVVPAKEELSGFTPGQMISFYCSKQKRDVKSVTSVSKVGEPLIFTHSSYWTYRSKDSAEQRAKTPVSNDLNEIKISAEAVQDSVPAENIRSESVITIASKSDRPFLSGDESSIPIDTENTLSDGDVNNSNDEDEDDCQDDGTESLTDSSQPQPPKRVKIFEGGFKSNEDYTYVRGRGRGKYVCEECGIRCKKPSMLKKHIRTHTDLRPYKCNHCSFAFKTKGNLTKHMKSKAHHKKCTELGIIPVPTTTDDSQIDAEALAKQEQIEKKKNQFSDGEEADDDDEEDTDESDDECESDASSLIVTSQNSSRMLTNGHSKKSDAQERSTDSFDESIRGHESTSQQAEEHEVARSLLNLSAFGEPSQWSTSTGDLTDVTSPCESDVGSLLQGHDQSLLSPSFVSHGLSSTAVSSAKSKAVSDQWLSTETLGHRPRSYSADIPLSGAKHVKYKLVKDIIAETGTKLQVDESSEFGSKDQYARRYSISVAREARKPRTLNSQEWASLNIASLGPRKLRDPESADQPMDLSITRDLGKCKSAYSADMAGSLINIVTQEEALTDMSLTTSLDSCLSESYQLKPLPVLSPQVLVDYETSDNNNTDQSLLPLIDDQSSLGTSTRSIFYMQDVPSLENVTKRKDTDIIDDASSPDMAEYAAVCSPVSPPTLEDSAYYYSQEGGQSLGNSEESASSSRHQAEFIVPSTSSSGNIEEGKCVCRICNKMFAKSSHLRLHVNIHYFERPFRCDNCAVSFRTKGHLQKHKRSVSHYNKVNMNLTFGTPSVDNPRPFKCADCKIAFRIHGHLAKHLRSKMHIMKLECLGKLPFGMYAEMERSGVSLNEIDTTDCNNSLESLQVMAQKLYQRDPRRMRWQGTEQTTDSTCVMPTFSTTNTQSLIDSMLPLAETSFDSSRIVSMPVSTLSNAKQPSSKDDVKQETSQTNVLHLQSANVDSDSAISSLPRYIAPQTVTSPGQEPAPHIEASALESAMSLNRSGTCHICGRHFKSAKFLQVHLYCDHPTLTPSSANETPSVNVSPCFTESGELVCDLCGKQFPNQKVLQQHLLSHAQPRPFVCEICDAGFTSSSSLVAHQVTHQNNPLVSTLQTTE